MEEIKLLLVSADDWEKAERLRKFLDQMESKLELFDEYKREKIKIWIGEQRIKADWLDPLVYVEDELLGISPFVFTDIINKGN